MAQSIQSIIDNRDSKTYKQSIIDNRLTSKVRYIHDRLMSTLQDDSYNIGFTVKIAGKLSEAEIYQVADYCTRKANHPGRAFVSICQRKLGEQ